MINNNKAPSWALGAEIPDITHTSSVAIPVPHIAPSTIVYNNRGKHIVTQQMIDRNEAPAWTLGAEIPDISGIQKLLPNSAHFSMQPKFIVDLFEGRLEENDSPFSRERFIEEFKLKVAHACPAVWEHTYKDSHSDRWAAKYKKHSKCFTIVDCDKVLYLNGFYEDYMCTFKFSTQNCRLTVGNTRGDFLNDGMEEDFKSPTLCFQRFLKAMDYIPCQLKRESHKFVHFSPKYEPFRSLFECYFFSKTPKDSLCSKEEFIAAFKSKVAEITPAVWKVTYDDFKRKVTRVDFGNNNEYFMTGE
jgi:hypothetical protein